jgi:hypothetical protein
MPLSNAPVLISTTTQILLHARRTSFSCTRISSSPSPMCSKVLAFMSFHSSCTRSAATTTFFPSKIATSSCGIVARRTLTLYRSSHEGTELTYPPRASFFPLRPGTLTLSLSRTTTHRICSNQDMVIAISNIHENSPMHNGGADRALPCQIAVGK